MSEINKVGTLQTGECVPLKQSESQRFILIVENKYKSNILD